MSTKQIQGKLWSVAPTYWSQHFEPYFLPMYKKTLEQLKLSETTMLLDAGCGAGLFSSMAIRSGAQVIGVDAAPGLLKVARQRNPANNFLEEDLEALPFTGESFDIVTGFNSFQYAGNFENAIREAKRVLKKDGRLVIGIWDKPEWSEATTVLKAISSLLPPPPPGTPGPFALSEDGAIEAILQKVGLNLVYKTTIGCPILYHNLSEGIKSFMGTGPAAAACNYADEITVREVIAEAIQAFHVADDFYHLQNQFLLFIAEK
ncbi:class I SAM-dependent methyltransferase [Terrimonas alba]|uniref:class I SAM-dependent methyltransferase n=1 Tax=Terrimonas alba TaxID=3349636 RepID=UPI0035F4E4C4